MKAIGKCDVCGGKIIQIGNGNVFCVDCSNENYKIDILQVCADRKEKQRIDMRSKLIAERQKRILTIK